MSSLNTVQKHSKMRHKESLAFRNRGADTSFGLFLLSPLPYTAALLKCIHTEVAIHTIAVKRDW